MNVEHSHDGQTRQRLGALVRVPSDAHREHLQEIEKRSPVRGTAMSRHRTFATVGLLVVLAAAGVGWAADDPLAPLPATFIGVLPCADCPSLRYHLNLFPDRSFFLRTTYLERPGIDPQDDIGSWMLSSDRRVLILKGGREALEMLALADGQRLRMLDAEARPLPASVPSELQRAESVQPLEPRLLFRGMYMYLADAGLFTECLTGQRWPVAQEGANATLEAAYLRARLSPGALLLASVEGRVAIRPRVEGPGTQPTLIVDRFLMSGRASAADRDSRQPRCRTRSGR
ncbi:MAG: copper resistance protein NlpE N-terminal domain-containing protein [Candidatus Rokuibacteriota bacterium]